MAGRPRQFDEDDALRRAIEVFWERGYEGVGVRELLDSMGVCRQSFYDTFGDKRQLFLRSIERYIADAEGWFRQRLEAPGSAAENLRGILRDKASGTTGGECRGCLAMNAMVEWGAGDEEIADLLRGNLRRVERMLVAAIRRAQDDGEIDAGADPKQLGQFFLFVCLGFSALERLGLPRSMARGVLETALGVIPAPESV